MGCLYGALGVVKFVECVVGVLMWVVCVGAF